MNHQISKSTLLLTALSFVFSIMQCKPKTEEAAAPKIEKQDTSGPEYTSKYICPMFCKGSGSDQPGVCPVCEMDYVLNENLDEPDQPSEPAEPGEAKEDSSHTH